MMNNKGQTLVMFVLLLPILLIILCLVFDVGNLLLEKRHIESVIKDAIKYELNNNDDINTSRNRLTNTLTKNIDNIKIKQINITNNKVITISISKEYKGKFTSILKNNLFTIDLTFKGYINGNDIVIKKE